MLYNKPGSDMLRLLVAIAVTLVLTTSPALAATSECTRENGPAPTRGQALGTPVELTIEPDKDVVNFAGGRGVMKREFVASPKSGSTLPDSLTAQQIELRTVRSFSRVGDKIESATLERPVTFTEPEINQDTNEIRFSACFDLAGSKPGSYVGQIRIAGPRGLARASAPVTINAQNETLFRIGLALALIAALIVMVIRKLTSDQGWIKFLGVAIPSLLAAGYAMYRIYAADPAWGADTTESVLTLMGAGLSAAGLKATVDAITPGSNG